MIEKILKWFRKEENEDKLHLPKIDKENFELKLDEIEIGFLECRDGYWYFFYSDSFKKLTDFYPIPGFPDLNKVYKSKSLWPFFQIRIPGLGQPAVKEILDKEQIDKKSELALLKRFGFKSIANPYTLVLK